MTDKPEALMAGVIEVLDGADFETAATVLCGLLGQLVARRSGGRPSEVKRAAEEVAENTRRVAIAVLLRQDEARRGDE